MSSAPSGFQAIEAQSGEPLKLAMQRLWLTGTILPAGARLWVQHDFRCAGKKPLEVIYAFALPRDAALRRFRVEGAGFRAHSELKPVEEAVKAYESGVEQGHLATLMRQYGDGVINLTLGNLRPEETVTVKLELLCGVELRDDGLRFRFPFTLAPGYHARARTIEAAPRQGEMELPQDEFGDVILPPWAAEARGLHEVGFDLSVQMAQEIEETASPSHPVRVARKDARCARVSLASERDVPDRDLVLDVRTHDPQAAVLSGVDSAGKGRFAAVIPSAAFSSESGGAAERRAVIVLDRSGSMSGAPIQQAKKAIEACLAAISESDRFGLIAFDDQVEEFRPALVNGSMANREAARAFLANVDARGGTELERAISRAASIAGPGGDVVVMTDGQVFGTETILASVRAAGVRVHCLGIGSASQDRFLALLARESGGVSRFLTARERVDLPAVDLFAATGEPAAEGVSVTVEGIEQAFIAPEPPASVPAGSPLLVFGETAGPGEGRLAIEVRRGRRVELHLTIGDAGLGETLRLMQGARLVTDLESRLDAAAPGVAKREQERIRKRLESLGSELGLANRRMALVAVVERAGDRPGEIPKTVVVPVGMPQDTDFGSYFQTAPLTSRLMKPARLTPARMPDLTVEACLADMAAPPPASRPKFKSGRRFASAMASYGPPEDDPLMDLIARLEPDGGMPGGSESERLLRSAAALLCLLAAGHSRSRGAFRMHVGRLMDYLRHSGLNDPRVAFALEMAERGKTPVGWPIQPQELMPERPLDAAAVCAAIDRMFPVA